MPQKNYRMQLMKTAEVEEGEELEEGEDSDSASAGLLGDEEEEEEARRPGGKSRARWSASKYGSGRKVSASFLRTVST